MNEYFCNYSQSLALKKLGFKEDCLATINEQEALHIKGTKNYPSGAVVTNIINCPLKSQVFEFFRDKKYFIISYIQPCPKNPNGEYGFVISQPFNDKVVYLEKGFRFNSFKEAENKCLNKLIELCKNC